MRLLAWLWQLRTLMIAVAAVGVALGGWRTIERRRVEFHRRATFHSAEWARFARGGSARTHANATCAEYQAEGYPPTASGFHLHPLAGLDTRAERAWMAYHEGQCCKYLAAMRRPWLPVAADPPAPPQPPDRASRFKRDLGPGDDPPTPASNTRL